MDNGRLTNVREPDDHKNTINKITLIIIYLNLIEKIMILI
jgi:hypothetical protein